MNFVVTTFDLCDIKIVTNKSSFWAKRLALPRTEVVVMVGMDGSQLEGRGFNPSCRNFSSSRVQFSVRLEVFAQRDLWLCCLRYFNMRN